MIALGVGVGETWRLLERHSFHSRNFMSDEKDREQLAPPPSLVEESQCSSLDWASTVLRTGMGELIQLWGPITKANTLPVQVSHSLLGQRCTWL